MLGKGSEKEIKQAFKYMGKIKKGFAEYLGQYVWSHGIRALKIRGSCTATIKNNGPLNLVYTLLYICPLPTHVF